MDLFDKIKGGLYGVAVGDALGGTTVSFSEVVQEAANLGGDSDTIGAIAGGLAGIACGYPEIPSNYSNVLLIKDRLDEVSERLYRLRNNFPNGFHWN